MVQAWEKAVQELGKMSAKIAWHSPRTLRYASMHLNRGKYVKVTSYKTVEFRIIINIVLSIKEWVVFLLRFQKAPKFP